MGITWWRGGVECGEVVVSGREVMGSSGVVLVGGGNMVERS